MKLIIILPMRSSANIPPQGPYRHSHKHNKHIWEGRELDPAEFNQVVQKAMHIFDDIFDPPYPQVVLEVEEKLKVSLSHRQPDGAKASAPDPEEVRLREAFEDPALAALRAQALEAENEKIEPAAPVPPAKKGPGRPRKSTVNAPIAQAPPVLVPESKEAKRRVQAMREAEENALPPETTPPPAGRRPAGVPEEAVILTP